MHRTDAREIAQVEAALAEISAQLDDHDLDPQPETSAPHVAFVTTLDPETPTRPGLTPELRAIMRAASARIAADNEAQREARNARRRATPEYRQMLADDRAAYADRIGQEEGRTVRSYSDLSAMTEAAKCDHKRAQTADRVWASRQRAAGRTETEIAEGLARRRAKRI